MDADAGAADRDADLDLEVAGCAACFADDAGGARHYDPDPITGVTDECGGAPQRVIVDGRGADLLVREGWHRRA
jgi:hypothetical protein